MSSSRTAQRRSPGRRWVVAAAAFTACLLPTGYGLAAAEAPADRPAATGGAHPGHHAEPGTAPLVPSGEDPEPDDPGRPDPSGSAPPSGSDQGAGSDPDGSDQGTGSGSSGPDPGDGAGSTGSDREDGAESSGAGSSAEPGHQHGSGEDGGEPSGDGAPGGRQQINGLEVLGRDCSNSDLPIHDGFQAAPRCIETAFGEVAEADQGPQLLITGAPGEVGVGEDFQLTISTRNLVRDRFLGAAAGGYYLERSFLDDEGLQRGHFHSACRMLATTEEAPEPAKADFFLATQDGGGGDDADEVTIDVTGLPRAGEAQCAVWAGDGSHRIPMMELVDQIPAFDTVRVTVR